MTNNLVISKMKDEVCAMPIKSFAGLKAKNVYLYNRRQRCM